MALGVLSWSTTAANNATADSQVDWHEGQAPSSVNDSARGMMSSVALWRNDIHGITATTGTGTAYSLASNQGLSTNLDTATFQFTPGTTNTGAVTLSVDGQAAKPIRFRTGADLTAGSLISGSLYQVSYRAAVQEWLLHSFDSSVYALPLGGMIDYAPSVAPNGSFLLAQGQAISRTTYAALFVLIGTTYGSGDGSTTFNIPDCVGRVTAMPDAGSSRLSASYFGGNPAALGAVGGAESWTIVTPNLPAYTPAGSVTNGAITIANLKSATSVGDGAHGNFSYYSDVANQGTVNTTPTQASSSFGGTAQGGTSTPIRTVQPTIILNKLIRVL